MPPLNAVEYLPGVLQRGRCVYENAHTPPGKVIGYIFNCANHFPLSQKPLAVLSKSGFDFLPLEICSSLCRETSFMDRAHTSLIILHFSPPGHPTMACVKPRKTYVKSLRSVTLALIIPLIISATDRVCAGSSSCVLERRCTNRIAPTSPQLSLVFANTGIRSFLFAGTTLKDLPPADRPGKNTIPAQHSRHC